MFKKIVTLFLTLVLGISSCLSFASAYEGKKENDSLVSPKSFVQQQVTDDVILYYDALTYVEGQPNIIVGVKENGKYYDFHTYVDLFYTRVVTHDMAPEPGVGGGYITDTREWIVPSWALASVGIFTSTFLSYYYVPSQVALVGSDVAKDIYLMILSNRDLYIRGYLVRNYHSNHNPNWYYVPKFTLCLGSQYLTTYTGVSHYSTSSNEKFGS